MRIKYLVITAVLATAILCFANPVSAVTIQELLAQIAALQAQLVELQAQQNNTTQTWCHTFNGDIRQGSSGSEVEALHIALQKEGFTISAQEVSAKKFYFSTISAVKSFQQKYMSEILTPFRLRIGTGFVGGSTRAKLNQLYGCTSSRTSCNSQNQCVVGGGGASCTSNTDCVSSTLPSITFTASDANNNVTTNLENKINTNITVQVGQTVKFDFSSTNATSCYVYANSVLMNNLTGTDVNGVEDSNITQGATSGRWQTLARTAGFTATYTVTCSNARGSASQNITLYSISSTQPSITVTSPNGGEVYSRVGNQLITLPFNFTGTNLPIGTPYEVRLISSDSQEKIIYNGQISHPIEYPPSYGAKIPLYEDWPIGNYKIRVIITVRGESYSDTSDNYFTITGQSTVWPINVQPKDLIYSNGNSSATAIIEATFDGKIYDPATVSMVVSCPEGVTVKNATNSDNLCVKSTYMPRISDGKYNLSVNLNNITSSTQEPRFKVHAYNTLGQLVGSSDGIIPSGWGIQLEANNSNQPSITVTSPNGGETWTQGSTHNISWQSSGMPSEGRIRLTLVSSSGAVSEIVSNIYAHSGTYTWRVGQAGTNDYVPAGNYKIKISTSAGIFVSDISDNYFTITAAATTCTDSDISFTHSDGLDYYTKGTTTGLWNWQQTTGKDFCLQLQNGQWPWNYDSRWDASNIIPSGNANLYPTCTSDCGVYEFSCRPGYSSGSDIYVNAVNCPGGCANGACLPVSNQPSITVTSPLAGQQLVQGQTYNITWTSSGITANDGIYIKLINDGIAGGSVYYISPNPTVISNGLIQPTIFGNVNTYSWTVPSSVTPGSQYYITLESTNAGNMSGKSTGYFTIASPSCKILDIFSQQVSGYLYHEMFIKANNLPAENNYKIAGADSWSGTGFTVVQRYSDGSALLKGNQTFNTTAKNYILARKATITLTDLSGNQKCSVIGTVASAPVQNQPQLASIADIIARLAQQIQAMFK